MLPGPGPKLDPPWGAPYRRRGVGRSGSLLPRGNRQASFRRRRIRVVSERCLAINRDKVYEGAMKLLATGKFDKGIVELYLEP